MLPRERYGVVNDVLGDFLVGVFRASSQTEKYSAMAETTRSKRWAADKW